VSTFQLAKWARLILCCFKALQRMEINLSSISNRFPKEQKKFILENFQKFTTIFYFLWGSERLKLLGIKKTKKRGLKIHKVIYLCLLVAKFSK
jgi:hypothetical protein